jgi:hypothetical protein
VWGNKDGKLYEPHGLSTTCAPENVINAYDAKEYP